MTREMPVRIRGEYITLDALLKVVGAAGSGAQAKLRIAEGEVKVDGTVETRKTRKLRGGELVEVDDFKIRLESSGSAA